VQFFNRSHVTGFAATLRVLHRNGFYRSTVIQVIIKSLSTLSEVTIAAVRYSLHKCSDIILC